jgi:hypothetical protein
MSYLTVFVFVLRNICLNYLFFSIVSFVINYFGLHGKQSSTFKFVPFNFLLSHQKVTMIMRQEIENLCLFVHIDFRNGFYNFTTAVLVLCRGIFVKFLNSESVKSHGTTQKKIENGPLT